MASDNSSQRRHDASADGIISQNESDVNTKFSLSADSSLSAESERPRSAGRYGVRGEDVMLQTSKTAELPDIKPEAKKVDLGDIPVRSDAKPKSKAKTVDLGDLPIREQHKAKAAEAKQTPKTETKTADGKGVYCYGNRQQGCRRIGDIRRYSRRG